MAQAHRPASYQVPVKGVVVRGGRVLLLCNERQEWELPGGRLEPGETPPQCVAREIAEETGWVVDTGPILDSWMYFIDQVQRKRLHRHLRLPPACRPERRRTGALA
jgi:8-oxo-dGTP pyrophosphatase MutT (NUDIX family)